MPSANPKYLVNYCFDAHHVRSILVEGYNFTNESWNTISFQKTVRRASFNTCISIVMRTRCTAWSYIADGKFALRFLLTRCIWLRSGGWHGFGLESGFHIERHQSLPSALSRQLHHANRVRPPAPVLYHLCGHRGWFRVPRPTATKGRNAARLFETAVVRSHLDHVITMNAFGVVQIWTSIMFSILNGWYNVWASAPTCSLFAFLAV